MVIFVQDEKYERMLGKLIGEVQGLLSDTVDTWEKLELLDNMEKLGLTYLFEHEIKKVLDTLVSNNNQNLDGEKDLYNTALLFTFLRKHGFHVSQGTHIPFTQFHTLYVPSFWDILQLFRFQNFLKIVNYSNIKLISYTTFTHFF